MTFVQDRPASEVGWELVGGDGERIATVDEVGPGYVLVRKGVVRRRDIYVPIAAITRVDPDEGTVSIEPSIACTQLQSCHFFET